MSDDPSGRPEAAARVPVIEVRLIDALLSNRALDNFQVIAALERLVDAAYPDEPESVSHTDEPTSGREAGVQTVTHVSETPSDAGRPAVPPQDDLENRTTRPSDYFDVAKQRQFARDGASIKSGSTAAPVSTSPRTPAPAVVVPPAGPRTPVIAKLIDEFFDDGSPSDGTDKEKR